MLTTTLTASAPAKLILLGEHAVVYGEPAIAVPFPALSVTAVATPAPAGAGLTIIAADVGRALHVFPGEVTPDNALVYAAQLVLRTVAASPNHSRKAPDLTLTVRSTIPIGSGFGSGAAVSAALMRALSMALGSPLEDELLNRLVYEVEKMHHGTPSGIDNTVIVFNRPVYFVREHPPEPFIVGAPLTFVVADSGLGVSTRETVGDVRRLVETEPDQYRPVVAQIGELVREARGAIERGDREAIGAAMNRDHDLLRTLTVSSETLDHLVDVARRAGAIGAKLSGGGRGGNVIALLPDESSADEHDARAEQVRAALTRSGAREAWVMTLNP